MKKMGIHSLITGFALFSMFFGAGNIIFPSYVGFVAGEKWFPAFLCYYMSDVGLALLTIFAMLRSDCIDRAGSVSLRLGSLPSKLMMSAVVLCIGPLLADPRTCAITFSMAVLPLVRDNTNILWLQVLFAVIYFGTVFMLTIRGSAFVDILGRYFTPILVSALLLMIIVGSISATGATGEMPKVENSIWMAISSGYQTMDVMAALVFGLVIVNALKAKGYTRTRSRNISVIVTSIVTGLIFFIIYGGLCYLGAAASSLYPENIDKGLLVANIAARIFGDNTAIIFGIIIGLSCLTTAVAVTGATATFFSTITNGRLSYHFIVTIVCLFSAVVTNFGLNNIIALAAPILTFLYPGILVVIVLSLFNSRISNDNIFKFATGGALIVSLFEVISSYFPEYFEFTTLLPLHSFGFSWVLPAAICGFIGAFFKTGHK